MTLKQTWFDRALGVIAPTTALRRTRARLATELLQRHYEAASVGRRTQGWRRTGGDANAVSAKDLATLREHARDLVRNNGQMAQALRTIANHTVGWGIVAKAVPANEHVANPWRVWAETPECDADGRTNLAGLQKLVMRTVAESGECLVRRRWRRIEDGYAIPMQLQVLEPDHLDTNKNGALPGGGQIINGVEFDALGERVAYWLFPTHPGASNGRLLFEPAKRYPAADILHVFERTRPGQVRAVSWFAPIILPAKDLDEYGDAQLMKQKIAACLSVITTDVDGSGTALGTGDDSTSPGTDMLEPGAIIQAKPGQSIEVVQPPAVNDYAAFTTVENRKLAKGLGLTYEDYTGDYCVAPDTLVLRADLRWVRADTLTIGTEIVAFDEHAPGGRGARRKWRKATVVRAGTRALHRRRIVTDRAAVTVSDEHLFLCTSRDASGAARGYGLQARSENPQTPGRGMRWVRADRLQPGDHIVYFGAPWGEGSTHLHGYLKGIADGEGYLCSRDAKIGIAQKPGKVYDEIGAALRSLGIVAVDRKENGSGVRAWTIMGIAETLRFLGEVRPTRLLDKAESAYEGRHIAGGPKRGQSETVATVEAVESVGVGDVVTLETSTRTLITEGLLSHNSHVNFSSARMARLSHYENVHDWRWLMLVPQFCDPVWAWAMQALQVVGVRGAADVRAEWTAPGMPMIEPDKEGLAIMRNARAGIQTIPEAIRERGYDPDAVLAEYKDWNTKIDAAGVVLDSDPRRVTQAGQLQGSPSSVGGSNGGATNG